MQTCRPVDSLLRAIRIIFISLSTSRLYNTPIFNMDASKKEIAEKLVNSNTLGLREMAGTIMSELEKNEKVKEVVVRVRVVRLPKGQKNNNKNRTNTTKQQAKCCKAKVSTLSYKFNVNQKNLHKLLLKRRQQLLNCSKNSTAHKLPSTNNTEAAAGSTGFSRTQNTAVLDFQRTNEHQQKINNKEWCNNTSTSHATADLNLSTSSPLSTTTFSAFSSPRDRSSFYGNIMSSPVSPYENSPSAPHAGNGNFDVSCPPNTFYRYDCDKDSCPLSDMVTESSIPSFSSTRTSTSGQHQQNHHQQHVNGGAALNSHVSSTSSTTTARNLEVAHIPRNLAELTSCSYFMPFASFTQQSQEGETRQTPPNQDSP